jgi:hypothetical protein
MAIKSEVFFNRVEAVGVNIGRAQEFRYLALPRMGLNHLLCYLGKAINATDGC